MKKVFLHVVFFVLTASLYAEHGNGPVAVSLTIDGITEMYRIGDADGWEDGLCDDINGKSLFTAIQFDSPTSLILNGGAAVSWINEGEYYLPETGYAIQYRVYPTSGGSKTFEDSDDGWETILLNKSWEDDGTDHFRGDNFEADIDILSLASGSGEFYFDVRFRAINYWNDLGPWSNYYFGRQNTFVKVDPNMPIMTLDSRIIQSIGLTDIQYTFDGSASPNAVTYSWFVNDVLEGSTAELQYEFDTPGTYTVKLAVTDGTPESEVSIEKEIRIFEQSATDDKIVGGNMVDPTKWGLAELGRSQPQFTWNSADTPSGATTALRFTKSNEEDGFSLYQPVYLEAQKTYIFDCLVKDFGTASNVWMQVFISDAVVPSNSQEVIPTIVEKTTIGQLNSWISGIEPANYEGSFEAKSAKGEEYEGDNCTFIAPATGMYFFIFRIGNHWGNMDISISNLSFTQQPGGGTNVLSVNSEDIILAGGISSISATLPGAATIALYTLQGALIDQKQVENEYAITGLPAGIYVLKVNDKAYKVAVK